jgi:tryptophanyl-tRNA synthetase
MKLDNLNPTPLAEKEGVSTSNAASVAAATPAKKWRHPFYLYTGRGPSADSMHLGHAVPFLLVRYLQRVFRCPLVIQLTDDEKFLFRDVPLASMNQITTNNIKDIIAFGFDKELTFIFRNTEYMGRMYPTVLEIQRLMTQNAVRHTFGFDDTDCVGKYAFAATQAAPSFASSFPLVLPNASRNFPCLIPCAIDQDPFFILTRSLCDRLKRPKPALLHTKFLPALKGATHKMSSSAQHHGVIMLNDSKQQVEKKVKGAFSGGCGTLEELQQRGADPDVDIAYQYLRFFHSSTTQVDELGELYRKGTVSSGDIKQQCIDCLWGLLSDWQSKRAAVTDKDVEDFCKERSILV